MLCVLLMSVTHLACIDMGISTAVFVIVGSYTKPFGVVLSVLPAFVHTSTC